MKHYLVASAGCCCCSSCCCISVNNNSPGAGGPASVIGPPKESQYLLLNREMFCVTRVSLFDKKCRSLFLIISDQHHLKMLDHFNYFCCPQRSYEVWLKHHLTYHVMMVCIMVIVVHRQSIRNPRTRNHVTEDLEQRLKGELCQVPLF